MNSLPEWMHHCFASKHIKYLGKKRVKLNMRKQINADFKAICKFLKLEETNLIIDSDKVSDNKRWHSSEFIKTIDVNTDKILARTIKLYVSQGYSRTSLVHECLHARGMKHHTGFLSDQKKDRTSRTFERRIFGETTNFAVVIVGE